MTEKQDIGARLVLGFGLLLAVMGTVAGANYWRTYGNGHTTSQTLPADAKFGEYSARAQASTMALRRNARNILLSVSSPEKVEAYRKMWEEQRASQAARLDDLEKYATRRDHRELVTAMRKELAHYDAGLTRILSLIEDGEIKTPQDANKTLNAWMQSGSY